MLYSYIAKLTSSIAIQSMAGLSRDQTWNILLSCLASLILLSGKKEDTVALAEYLQVVKYSACSVIAVFSALGTCFYLGSKFGGLLSDKSE